MAAGAGRLGIPGLAGGAGNESSIRFAIPKRRAPHVRGTILLVGAGKMGSALLEGWLALGLAPDRLAVIEPHPSNDLGALVGEGLRLNPSPHPDLEIASLVIAIKPQVAPQVMQTLAPFVGAATVVVSIMAGRTLRFLHAALPHAALVRAMPNTPAAIGRGITVVVPTTASRRGNASWSMGCYRRWGPWNGSTTKRSWTRSPHCPAPDRPMSFYRRKP